MTAGSMEAILYAFFQLADEISHALNPDGIPVIDKYTARFCHLAHRKDGQE